MCNMYVIYRVDLTQKIPPYASNIVFELWIGRPPLHSSANHVQPPQNYSPADSKTPYIRLFYNGCVCVLN